MKILKFEPTLQIFMKLENLFETAQLHQLQLSFTNLTIEQLILRVDKIDDSIWLSDQLQFHENEILMRIAPYDLKMTF
jgi:hypothetical protein